MSEVPQHATGRATMPRRDAVRDAQGGQRAQAGVKVDALAAARELSPIIARLRNETEANRRLAEPIVERLVETRLCRMAVAKSLQGLELPVAESCEVYEVLAAAEASVAWIVWNNSLPCFFGRFLEKSARDELFGDPRWLYASSTRPTGRAAVEGDGYRVNGRWAIVSGCELAEWIALMCIVEENGVPRVVEPGVPEMRIVFVRRGDYDILDTWHVGGLRGTGSHDVVVKDKHVPRRWTVAPRGRCEHARRDDRPDPDHLHDGRRICVAGARSWATGSRYARAARCHQGESRSGARAWRADCRARIDRTASCGARGLARALAFVHGAALGYGRLRCAAADRRHQRRVGGGAACRRRGTKHRREHVCRGWDDVALYG